MKAIFLRLLSLALIFLLALSLFACGKKNSPEETLDYVTETYEQEKYVTGIVVSIESDDLLKVDLALKYDETYGDEVYVRTSNAKDFCLYDEISVNFTSLERPVSSEKLITLIATKAEVPTYWAKPIIYLYPEEETECSVKLSFNGKLTCTYPEHGDSGWESFTAYPDGTLVFPDGKEYYCLYWEGTHNTDFDFSKGFCVKGEDTAGFLEWALSEQGLTPREANEFIIYWLPVMQENEYNVISFQTDIYTDNARLEIFPNPDSLLRIFMAFYPSNTEVEIEAQAFDTFDRNGFTVIEWGGVKVK